MKTAKTQPLPSGPNSPGSARGTRRRQWPLMIGTAVVVVLFILGCRWMVGDSLAVFEKVARQDCQDDGYCVSWVSYPELLVAGGRQEVHVYQAGMRVTASTWHRTRSRATCRGFRSRWTRRA